MGMGDAPGEDRLDVDGVRVNAAGLPAMLGIAWLLDRPSLAPLFYFFRGTYHELGHAVGAWLGGRFALPIPLLLTIVSEDRSVGVELLVLGSLAGGAWLAVRARRIALAMGLGSLLAVAIVLTFAASRDDALLWGIFAGCGGEIALAAIVVLLFYADLPDRARWDFWRWPVVFVACCVLVHADGQWRAVAIDGELLPRGTGIAGSGDVNGDMDRLLRGGWTTESIVGAYLTLADAAWLAIGGLYVARVLRAVRRSLRDAH